MASEKQVREYLAHWFQLGKPIVLNNGQTECLPYPIYFENRYSQAFEECWQQILQTGGQGCYLKGTSQTIDKLLSSAWAVIACARCSMPVPLPDLGYTSDLCPCNDLAGWPNIEAPQPRPAVDSRKHLSALQQRLEQQEAS
ncbi:MAG TPA: hypothetical protein V6D06_17785 [Trichocoleus sp.]